MEQPIVGRNEGFKPQPAVRKAVQELRRECLTREPGSFLGLEADLQERYKISRPTLRQVAALLGQEQLITVRRGPNGGYFTTRPDVSSVVHMAAIWLQLQQVDLTEIFMSTTMIRAQLASLAAINCTDSQRAELKAFLERDRSVAEEDYDFSTFLKFEFAQITMIGNYSQNRVLHLYMQISLDLADGMSRAEHPPIGRFKRFLQWRELRNRMLDAVVEGDPEVARLRAERCGVVLMDWVAIDSGAKVVRPVSNWNNTGEDCSAVNTSTLR